MSSCPAKVTGSLIARSQKADTSCSGGRRDAPEGEPWLQASSGCRQPPGNAMENTCGQRQSRFPLPGSAPQQRPGHTWTHTGFSPFKGTDAGGWLGAALPCPQCHSSHGAWLPTPPCNHGPHPALYSGGEKRQQERNKNRKRKFTGAECVASSQGGGSR